LAVAPRRLATQTFSPKGRPPNMTRRIRWVGVPFAGILAGTLSGVGCGDSDSSNVDWTGEQESLTAACSFKVTTNVYDGPNYWGTFAFKNNGPATAAGYSVDFDLPSGAHCTNDAVPAGAKLSPLNGTGPTASTVSNHCTFTWASASLAPGASV